MEPSKKQLGPYKKIPEPDTTLNYFLGPRNAQNKDPNQCFGISMGAALHMSENNQTKVTQDDKDQIRRYNEVHDLHNQQFELRDKEHGGRIFTLTNPEIGKTNVKTYKQAEDTHLGNAFKKIQADETDNSYLVSIQTNKMTGKCDPKWDHTLLLKKDDTKINIIDPDNDEQTTVMDGNAVQYIKNKIGPQEYIQHLDVVTATNNTISKKIIESKGQIVNVGIKIIAGQNKVDVKNGVANQLITYQAQCQTELLNNEPERKMELQ